MRPVPSAHRRSHNDKLARNAIAMVRALPCPDGVKVPGARPATGLTAETRPRKRCGSSNERRVAGLITVEIVQSRRDSGARGDVEASLGTEVRERISLSQTKKQRADLARDF